MKRGILIILLIMSLGRVYAQNDPALASMILLYTERASQSLKNQEMVMSMMSTGHIWTKEEVKATADLQREFNTYLDSFRSIISYAAQVYGFYHEIKQMIDNMDNLSSQINKSPKNALAVALSANRNNIYQETIAKSLEIVNDIRTLCLSKTKQTEKERLQIVYGIRPKLKAINKKLHRLILAVKYTSLNDVWLEISEGARPMADKKEIVNSARERWREIGRKVRP